MEEVTVQQVLAKDSEKEFRWTVMAVRQHFNSPCIHKAGKTKKDLPCENLFVKHLAVGEAQLFSKVI